MNALLVIAQATPSGNSDAYLIAAIVLGGIALLLLGLELVIPTGGLLGLLCGISAVASIVAMFMWSITAGLLLLMAYAIGAPFLLLFLLKLWASSPLVRRYALNDGPSRDAGVAPVVADSDPDADDDVDLARMRRLHSLAQLVGRRGVAETPLRPVGFIALDGRRIDAVAESGLIEAGTPVRVVAVLDGTLKVRAE
ncbi:MAG: NfeD family protein [Phycisphaerae bacterium]|nr:NfeD family protein [Phycisphaerae bacterium]